MLIIVNGVAAEAFLFFFESSDPRTGTTGTPQECVEPTDVVGVGGATLDNTPLVANPSAILAPRLAACHFFSPGQLGGGSCKIAGRGAPHQQARLSTHRTVG